LLKGGDWGDADDGWCQEAKHISCYYKEEVLVAVELRTDGHGEMVTWKLTRDYDDGDGGGDAMKPPSSRLT
jgi:hypothetical protein